MTHLNIEKISLACRDREKEEQKKNSRKKNILLLIYHFLENNGFIQTMNMLSNESRFPFSEYIVCDNIDLNSILQDFESYYFLKYQKLPHIIKKLPDSYIQPKQKLRKSRSEARAIMSASEQVEEVEDNAFNRFGINITSNSTNEITEDNIVRCSESIVSFENYSPEMKAMANIVMQDFSKTNNNSLKWSDIVGHEKTKQILKEAIVYPFKYHHLFPTVSSTWKSILLYGPTGTGKTLLATAAAVTSKVAFFNISISTLVSKWRGESEKLVKVLFDLAKFYAPSIIFIDEIDALMSHRGCDHEASRRMKTEFFLQMDALSTCDKFVLLIGASNMPWELDCAILRRMEKRILVSLPDFDSRCSLFEKYLTFDFQNNENIKIKTNFDYNKLAEVSESYSASDIELVCKEVKMGHIRSIVESLEMHHIGKNVKSSSFIKGLETSDVLLAIDRIKPASVELIQKYMDWKEKHGSE
ncbi:katanin p60 ATPase-containing subunit A-like 2 [Caerostris darwini]|uniref:Katanin p60 ATPase-containing subunit A-like 2 n=1 Tax=Caerostris darwini TaxID=1538125 RepID=A0AAV4N9Z8_9ARAC|nr:katanin p60 ATPase-containing subunit A-like 2 [Caerostris darwini]